MGKKLAPVVVEGLGFVMVHVSGIGLMAGPPARELRLGMGKKMAPAAERAARWVRASMTMTENMMSGVDSRTIRRGEWGCYILKQKHGKKVENKGRCPSPWGAGSYVQRLVERRRCGCLVLWYYYMNN